MRPPFLLIPDKILQKNRITEPGSLADLLPTLMGNAGSCAKCGSDGKEPNAHGEFETHAHKKVRRPSAYISTHSLLSNMGSSAALFGGQGGNITRQVTSLLLRASEVVTDFFMCITQPIAHLCGAWPAVLFYIEHKDAH